MQAEHEASTELKQNTDINLKKADNGSTTVVMKKTDKIIEGQIQIDDKHNYRPLSEPMLKETHSMQGLAPNLVRIFIVKDILMT